MWETDEMSQQVHPLVQIFDRLTDPFRAVYPPANRDGKGRFMKGASANPGGFLRAGDGRRPHAKVRARALGLHYLHLAEKWLADAATPPAFRAALVVELIAMGFRIRRDMRVTRTETKLRCMEAELSAQVALVRLLKAVGAPPEAIPEPPEPPAGGWPPTALKPPGQRGRKGLRHRAHEAAIAAGVLSPDCTASPIPAPLLPEARGGEAEAQAGGDGSAQPGEAPKRPFRISLPA
jgi:hypothetical protein